MPSQSTPWPSLPAGEEASFMAGHWTRSKHATTGYLHVLNAPVRSFVSSIDSLTFTAVPGPNKAPMNIISKLSKIIRTG